jgi:hypothetical protein
VAQGTAREIACFGARGDGKTWAALWAMVMHAVEHHKAGFPLPTTWIGLRDTHRNHVQSTKKSLTSPSWPAEAKWVMSDGDHLATFSLQGIPFVRLELIGADSPADAERVRTEAHGLWVDEPAPAAEVSNGITDELYYIASSSARLDTHRRVSMLTSNYPDSDHWTAQRFVFEPQPGTQYFRIPGGERASAEYRAELERLYATRPDLARRLVRGEFGSVMLGDQVAVGFSRAAHVKVVRPFRGVPIWLGQDGGHTPTTVIGQRAEGRARILGALSSEHAGMRQHMTELVLPWIGEHCPWALEGSDMVQVRYDPSLDTDEQADIESNPLRVMRALLAGHYRPGPVTWEGRKDPMLRVLNTLVGGEPLLEVDPYQARGLVKALDGGWYYALGADGRMKKADTASGSAQPKKPNHPHEDYGDAFCYLVAGMCPTREVTAEARKPYVAKHRFNPLGPKLGTRLLPPRRETW